MDLPPLTTALVVAAMWAIPSITQKVLLDRFSIQLMMTVSAVSYLIAISISMAPRWTVQEWHYFFSQPKWVLFAVLSAIVGGFIPNYLFSNLLTKHPSYWVTAVTYCSPLFTTFLAVMFLRERPTMIHLFGISLIVCGIVCVSR